MLFVLILCDSNRKLGKWLYSLMTDFSAVVPWFLTSGFSPLPVSQNRNKSSGQLSHFSFISWYYQTVPKTLAFSTYCWALTTFDWMPPRSPVASRSDRTCPSFILDGPPFVSWTTSPWSRSRSRLNLRVFYRNWSIITSNDFVNMFWSILAAEIQPVCLAPPSEPDHVDDILHVSGWGRHSECKSNIFIFLIRISRLHWNDISLL